MIVTIISIIVILSYVVLIAAITIGWFRLKEFKSNAAIPFLKVSIVVAVRNEAANIDVLIRSLLAQDYPADLFEIIIIDDHSTDETNRLIQEFVILQKDSERLKLIIQNNDDRSGKKAALSQGIELSKGELIIITDADSTAGKKWISTLAAFYSEYKPQMILGPVSMNCRDSFFGRLQSLEFMSLISSAAGSCNAGFPILANGANIAFTRHAYESCGGFSGNMHFSSGDDMFLMMSIKKKFGSAAIRFLRSEDAIVSTPSTRGVKPFIRQRMRWVSKSRGYTDPLLIATAIIVFLTNILLLISASAALFFPGYGRFFLLLYLVKLLIDFPIMISFSRFQKSSRLLWLFPIMELLNSFYTFAIGIAGNIGKYEWKGRKF